MYARAVACDFDGTVAANGQLSAEFCAAAGRARAQGWAVLLVTGRVMDDLHALCGDLGEFDAIVAENGAIVFIPGTSRTIQLGEPPPESFLAELRSRAVPFHAGAVIVGTWESHLKDTFEAMRRQAVDSQIILNRGAVMVLPSNVNKATGVRRALSELRRSEHNLIAFGDAENDLPFFAAAELSVAAADSVPAVGARADERLSSCGGSGVARYINEILDRGGHVTTPKRSQIRIGQTADGQLVSLPGSGVNVMISGDPRSGKSWLAGLVAEQFLERGYRLCVLDAEGDYASLGRRPEVLVLGCDLALPTAKTVARVMRERDSSLVLSLGSLSAAKQVSYAAAVLEQLAESSAATGIPHWIIVDEAQYFFNGRAPCGPFVAGNVVLSTHRPSVIPDAVHGAIGAHLIARTVIEEERYFVSSLLRNRGPAELNPSDALEQLDTSHFGLLLEDSSGPRWQVFSPAARTTMHTHHGGKYADTQLPDERAFRFISLDGSPLALAHNVNEFHRAVASVPQGSLRHHLTRADFSRWATEVLGDQSLARGFRKLERATQNGAEPNRAEILIQIGSRYHVGGGAQGDESATEHRA